MILPSAIDAIGNTPLVELTRACAALGVQGRILAKLDFLLPGFSKKDRAAKAIIEAARADGSLQPRQPVVELTSGNMGTGLAIVCGVLEHPFIAVMSRGNSVERARMMAALGAEVVLVDQVPGGTPGQVSGADLALVEAAAQRVTAERGPFAPTSSGIRAILRRMRPGRDQSSGINLVARFRFLPISSAPAERWREPRGFCRPRGLPATRLSREARRRCRAVIPRTPTIRYRAGVMEWQIWTICEACHWRAL